jgi:molybdopterin-containing oxidoreductase family membrane subunit
MVFLSIWIDKGLGLIITGFIPTPFGKVVQYWPTVPEALISLSIWAIGIFLITIFYKITLSVRRVLEI